MADITGTNGPETLDGTPDADTINGLGGNDTLNGLGGDETLNGGTGVDNVNGGDGNDTIVMDSPPGSLSAVAASYPRPSTAGRTSTPSNCARSTTRH